MPGRALAAVRDGILGEASRAYPEDTACRIVRFRTKNVAWRHHGTLSWDARAADQAHIGNVEPILQGVRR